MLQWNLYEISSLEPRASCADTKLPFHSCVEMHVCMQEASFAVTVYYEPALGVGPFRTPSSYVHRIIIVLVVTTTTT